MTLMVVVAGVLALAVGMQSGDVPPWLAIAGLSACYYLVFTVTARKHARVPGRVLNLLLLGQIYPLIHHLWTTIPWYRYQRAFREIQPDLIARGAPIGWKSRAERPSASAPA